MSGTPVDRRAHGRNGVHGERIAVWLVRADGKKLLGCIIDAGDGGARVELSGPTDELAAGERLGLEPGAGADDASTRLPGHGEVVWTNGLHLGLRFVDG